MTSRNGTERETYAFSGLEMLMRVRAQHRYLAQCACTPLAGNGASCTVGGKRLVGRLAAQRETALHCRPLAQFSKPTPYARRLTD